ncbi:DUF4347 domain-containing protein, partial [Chlorobium phaeovibrioides]
MSVAEPHAVCLEQACERAYRDVNKRLTLKSPEVLLYDPGVAEVEVLLAGLDPAVQPLAVQSSDSPQEILAFLISHPQLTALHILGHGGPGAVRFGGVQLNAEDFHVPVDALIQRARLIDIYFWSCRTAQGTEGTTYLQAISENSMANVHASTGLIGETAKGGSWELDVTVSPTVRMPFSSEAREAFEGVLAVPTAADKTLTTDEDTDLVLTASDFGFADADSGATLASVKITTLETAGSLKYLDGTTWSDVTADQVITESDITAGRLKFVPAADANGASYDTFKFTVNDGTADSATANTITVAVTAVNDAPVAMNDTGSVAEDATLTVDAASGVLADDTDVDADATSTVTAIRTGAVSAGNGTSGSVGTGLVGTYGTLTIASDGSYTYVADQAAADDLDADDTVTDTFTYTVSDGNLTDTAELVITVTGSNDAPTVSSAITSAKAEGDASYQIDL